MKKLLVIIVSMAIFGQIQAQDITLKRAIALKENQSFNYVVDLDKDGFAESIMQTETEITIMDGKEKAVKYSIELVKENGESVYIDDMQSGRLRNTTVIQDYNGNGVKDILITGSSPIDGGYLKIIDPSTRTEVIRMRFQGGQDYLNVLDMDGDLFYDIIIGRTDSVFMYGTKAKVIAGSVGMNEENVTTEHTAITGNYPNPFNVPTQIRWYQPKSETVLVMVFNEAGDVIKTISVKADNGMANVMWDGTNQKNEIQPAGVYLYKIAMDGKAMTGKMMMIR